jgi:hypothetical protein
MTAAELIPQGIMIVDGRHLETAGLVILKKGLLIAQLVALGIRMLLAEFTALYQSLTTGLIK